MERADKQLEDARKIAAEPWDGEENLANLKAELTELEQKELEKGQVESDGDDGQDEEGPSISASPVSDGGQDGDEHPHTNGHGI